MKDRDEIMSDIEERDAEYWISDADPAPVRDRRPDKAAPRPGDAGYEVSDTDDDRYGSRRRAYERHRSAENLNAGDTGNGGRGGRSADNRAGQNGQGGQGGQGAGSDAARRKRRPVFFGGDKVLWTIIIILIIFSVLLTLSATIYKPGGTPTRKFVMQAVFIAIGFFALWGTHIIKYQFYGHIARAVFIFGLGLTVAAMLFGTEGAGARRDIYIPGVGISFQPFEILKIGLIMLLAKRLARRQKDIDDTPIMPSYNPMVWKEDPGRQWDIIKDETIPLLGPIFIACIFSFLSVGNSTTLIMAVTCLGMLYIGRVRKADLLKIIGTVAVLGLVLFAAGVGRSDTGVSRMRSLKSDMLTKHARINSDSVEVYYYPETVTASGKIDPAEPNQSINAKMSIASGRFFGKGPGMSTHRSNLEEAEKDFAYAFLIEEYGALGGLILLLLYLWLFFRSIEIFKKCGTAFPSLLVLGLGLMITLQAMIHMLVSVALFPVTGQQLPLISKGGSSLIFTLMALGMILGVSRQTAERTLDTPKDESLFETPKPEKRR